MTADGPAAPPPAEAWATALGETWAARQPDLDRLLAPALDLLLAEARPAAGETVLDVGCGAGATTFAFAAAVAPEGRVLGLDVSPALLARAEALRPAQETGAVTFRLGDAETADLAGLDADLVASRFGLMFFADTRAAFANLRTALRPGGRIAFVAFAGPEENPWFAVPRRVLSAHAGPLPVPPPDAPGPMAFRDAARVRGLLSAAGFEAVESRPASARFSLPGGVAEIARLSARMPTVRGALAETPDPDAAVAEVQAGIEAGFRADPRADETSIPAGLLLFSARRP